MNVLIISNLILFLIFLCVYLYIKSSISSFLFYNVLFLDILIYFVFPVLVSIVNSILYISLKLNNLLILIVLFVPLTIPIYKIISKIIKFILVYKLYKIYEDRIYYNLMELLASMNIYVDKSNIILSLYKHNNVIYCDAYIKVLDIKDKNKKKDELKFKLADTFKNIKFNIIFDVKFNYKQQ